MQHILIVEDSALILNALRILFEVDGYRVSTAGDLESGVRCAVEGPVDILLLDLSLPDGDGLDLLPKLRERDALPKVTIALTGHDDDVIRAQCLSAGCRAVLVKPVPARELLAQVRSL